MSTSTASCACDDTGVLNWASDQIVTVTCDDASCDAVITAAPGDKQKVVVNGVYQPKGGGFDRNFTMDVNALVS